MDYRIKEMLPCQLTLMAGVTIAQTLVPGAEVTIPENHRTAAVVAYLFCQEDDKIVVLYCIETTRTFCILW